MSRSPAAFLLALAATLTLSSCGSSSRYADTLPLSSERFLLPGTEIVGMVPAGWSLAAPEGAAAGGPSVTLSEGDTFRIAFRPITLDAPAEEFFRRRGLKELAAMVRTLHDTAAGTRSDGIERFRSGATECAAFETGAGEDRKRVVVFTAGGKWFECEGWATSPLRAGASRARLFSAQQSAIRSMRPR